MYPSPTAATMLCNKPPPTIHCLEYGIAAGQLTRVGVARRLCWSHTPALRLEVSGPGLAGVALLCFTCHLLLGPVGHPRCVW